MADAQTIIDRLRRAYEMEEQMAEVLFGMLQTEANSDELSSEQKAKVMRILRVLNEDTLRHKTVVESILKRLEQR